MPRLTAQYQVPLPTGVLVRADGFEDPGSSVARFDRGGYVLSFTRGDFDIVLRIDAELDGAKVTPPGEAPIVPGVGVCVEVSRLEDEPVPELPPPTNGGQSVEERGRYFDARRSEYDACAQASLARLMTYLRFQKGQPGGWGVGDSPPSFPLHPVWLDEERNPIRSGIVSGTVWLIGTLGQAWHVAPLEPTDKGELVEFLQVAGEVPLHRTVAAQAKDAAVSHNLRRAVMELAIACEVAVKQAMFAPQSAAGEAFEYLEDQKRVRVSVMELVDGPAESAFGQSFKDRDPARYQLLEELFRCRNKVAHRGLLTYRDKKSALHTADRERVRLWLEAATELFDWLEGCSALPSVM